MQRVLLCACLLASVAFAQGPGPDVAPFINVSAPVFVLDHVQVIDGTGAPAKEDQAVVVANGKIQMIGAAGSASIGPDNERPLKKVRSSRSSKRSCQKQSSANFRNHCRFARGTSLPPRVSRLVCPMAPP